ncbi:cytokine-inducible SH2-containing protein-like [Amphibalanus amphitrite]|uniref:cytokine-inducible SH2-containing protein-like n=1 Tax=Amphibalanus amphitrite TaxID=1232801 RepID=UPI001C901F89|nr:cytokine-inducible SH2-containing protein-like [Amphibalanus amphitrite]
MLSRVQSGFERARERRPAADFYRYDAERLDDDGAGDDALGGDCWCAPVEPGRPQYRWENIPPRLTTAANDSDLLQLPDDGDDDGCDGFDDEPMPAAPSACWWTPRSAPQRGAAPATGACSANSISVSIGADIGAEQPEKEQRRPLHTSGGRLAAPQQRAGPQIAIGLPASSEPSSRIQLQISGCPSSVTVSVQTHAPAAAAAAPRPRRPRPAVTAAASAARPEQPEPEEDKALARALGLLRESGWYYGALSWQQAQLALQSTAEGTFLARDSHHRRFVFALSMQTAHGPTSMRVQLWRGRFRLDAAAELLDGMPTFADVHALVEHYARQGLVAVDGVPVRVRLGRPLKRTVPSLQHCCRLALNAAGCDDRRLALLPAQLRTYLDQYPYSR